MANYKGLLYAEGEGFYEGKKLILKVTDGLFEILKIKEQTYGIACGDSYLNRFLGCARNDILTSLNIRN